MILSPDMVLGACRLGYFPMAQTQMDTTVYWVDPEWRGVLPLNGLHIPKSLKKKMKKHPYHMTFNKDFEGVIEACAASTERRPDTWINGAILSTYTRLYDMHHAHSLEVWDRETLVGGLYGVSLGGAFFGESMVSMAEDASKIALVALVMRLISSGFTLLDTQFRNAHLARFGVVEVPRGVYHEQLKTALEKEVVLDTSPVERWEIDCFLENF